MASIETGPAVGDPFVEPGGPQGAQYAAASAALNGFDMVVAVSEATLNFQLAHLFKHKLLPQAASSEDPQPSIKLTFGPPTVDLQMATSRFDQDGRSAVLRMHVTTGVHESCATSPSVPTTLDGITLAYCAPLAIADVSLDTIQQTQAAADASAADEPFSLLEAFSDFSDELFDYHRLFLDLTNVTPEDWDAGNSDFKGLDINVVTDLIAYVAGYLGQDLAPSNPFVVGYGTTAKAPSALPPDQALLAPTAATYSASAQTLAPGAPDPGLATLNYLLVSGRDLPAGPAGQFAKPWIASQDTYAVLAVSRGLFRRGYVAQEILPALAAAMGVSEPFAEDGSGWVVSDLSANRYTLKNADSGMVNVHVTDTQQSGCGATIADGADPVVLTAEGFFYRKIYFEENPLGIHTDYWADARQPWTLTIQMSAGADGTVVLAPTATKGDVVTSHGENSMAKLGDAVAGLFGKTMKAAMEDIDQRLQPIEKQLVQQLGTQLAASLQGLAKVVILPAGQTFLYKHLHLSPEGNLLIDATPTPED